MADESGPGLRAHEHGSRDDPRGRFDGLEFRDENRTCIVIASGPSAADALGPAASWRDWPCLTVNDSWRLAPHAAAVYAADYDWWIQRDAGLRYVDLIRVGFRGGRFTSDARAAKDLELRHIALERKAGLSTVEGLIRTGGIVGNSGAQAINLAYLWGARRILLVGFDMCKRGDVVHWFGDHPRPLKNDPAFARFVEGMGPMAADLHAAGVEVINCCRWSALPYWPKRTLVECLEPSV